MKNKYLLIIGLTLVLNCSKVFAYANFTKILHASDFYYQGSTTQEVGFVKIENNRLIVSFSVNFLSPNIINSIIIPFGQNIPNMEPVYYSSTGPTTGYFYSVANNSLRFTCSGQPFNVSSCSSSTNQQIPCLPLNWYQDFDNDTFGNPSEVNAACVRPDGFVRNNTDCNDNNILINPNTIWYEDNDDDGFGSTIIIATDCIKPPLSSLNNLDCDDTTNTIKGPLTWYIDADIDGFGEQTPTVACIQPTGYVNNNLDNCPDLKGSVQGCIVPQVTASNSSTAFGNDMNYIITSAPKIETTNLQAITDEKDVVTAITYFDGLGRPIQKIAHGQSTSGKDIITPIAYDDFGRQPLDFLPFKSSTNTLNYDTNSMSHQKDFYLTPSELSIEATAYPYSQKEFENSPLNRVFEQAAPGDTWQMSDQHTIRMGYQTNSENEVRYFQARTIWNPTLKIYDIGLLGNADDKPDYYAENQLYKSVTKNENWVSADSDDNTTQEFKDKEGRVILKRTFNGRPLDTYYVYDDYGNLTYVLPPLVLTGDPTELITNKKIDGLCYQYKYDSRNRLAEKKLPGKQWEFIVYDKLDRPILTGPAYSPYGEEQQGWMFTQYDVFGRVAFTGWLQGEVDSNSRADYQSTLGNQVSNATLAPSTISEIQIHYTSTTVPADLLLLTVTYYDKYYDYPNSLPTNVFGKEVLTNVKSLPTSTWTRILDIHNPNSAETTFTFYDKKGRAIQTHKNNYLGGFVETSTLLDFVGKPIKTITKHKRQITDPNDLITTEEFLYNAQDKLLQQTHQVNSEPVEIIVANTYDELGQLISKVTGKSNTSILQKIDYRYNIRGWLTDINNTSNLTVSGDPVDLFAFKINYDQVANTLDGQIKPLYNGNISETFWTTNSDNIQRKYGYQYDPLNRLTKATYQKPFGSMTILNSYDEEIFYDNNGNISFLSRNGGRDTDSQAVGPQEIDRLEYVYDPNNENRLMKVTDTSGSPQGFKDDALGTTDPNDTEDDFRYDENGNMIKDENKHIIKITYNHLNLPVEILFANTNGITYFYNAVGQKVKKVVHDYETVTATDYLDGYQYVNGELKFFPHAEGYVNVLDTKYYYVYNYLDHLGNIRLSYGIDPKTHVLKVIEENNYYPFGLKHTNYNSDKKKYEVIDEMVELKQIPSQQSLAYKYKYNGKELQDELGLNLYDYGSRLYDPARAGWSNIDPLAEKMRRYSPYNYCFDNPLRFTDPDGMSPKDIILPKDEAQRKIVVQAINELKSSSATAKAYIERIENDKTNHVTINVDSGNRVPTGFLPSDRKGASTEGKGSGGTITWNPTQTNIAPDKLVDGTSKVEPSRALLEELVHGSRAVGGETAVGDSKAGLEAGWDTVTGTANEEIETNTVVNQSLSEMGQGDKQRTTYTMSATKTDEEGAILGSKKIALPIPIVQ